MPAQPSLAPVTEGPRTATLGAPAPAAKPASAPAAAPTLAAVPTGGYHHIIESGESLYTIARRYDVTAQAIVQANGLSSPDKIFVGQAIVIPGRPDLVANRPQAKPADASVAAQAQVPAAAPAPIVVAAANPAPVATPVATPAAQPPAAQQTRQASVPLEEPKMSGADKFRWPVTGKVITDFASSKATGINIEVPEGTAVRAAENGTVIYVGNGVEGYGNLVLIRHANGFVSAYAHLKDMSVTKGDQINRGDAIGRAGMTGSVNRPQLHFELRKGATPVDPMPLLAS